MEPISKQDIQTAKDWFETQTKLSGYIDIENRVIKGISGKLYYISPETIRAGRWSEYQVQTLELAYQTNFQSLTIFLAKGINALRGITFNGNFGEVHDTLKDFEGMLESTQNVTSASVPQIIKYCSLFCIGPDEDLSKYDPLVVEAKYKDWAHIPALDFFLLSTRQMPLLEEIAKAIQSGMDAGSVAKAITELVQQKRSSDKKQKP